MSGRRIPARQPVAEALQHVAALVGVVGYEAVDAVVDEVDHVGVGVDGEGDHELTVPMGARDDGGIGEERVVVRQYVGTDGGG